MLVAGAAIGVSLGTLGTLLATNVKRGEGQVVGTLSPAMSAPWGMSATITEDDPRWDCLRMGNVTCRIDGVLMTSIEDMPGVEVPYDRCLFLLAISARVSEFEYDASACDDVESNLG